jgi:large conductance mechanosensitive channel
LSEELQEKMLDELKQIKDNTAPAPTLALPKELQGFIEEFTAFLKEYGVIGLAIAFIKGGTSGRLVSALVTDIVKHIISFFLPRGSWQEAE